ncbi:protein kinase domain-containing protein [Sorangium sp. So ce1151]|uniref:bifunctional serine/threonine-protein kinase/formylglycine-generating enzyme family protein n=1 Tax=Sorangium sp. So ce1151 TaxID=3133332 RepID=UPI003F61143F
MSELRRDPWSQTLTVVPEATGDTAPLGALRLPARYRDQGRIAAGSFGEVRRVHDTELDRVVAMKLLRADVASAAQSEARFLAEIKLTAGLEHPGIIAVHDGGRLDDGRLWFTMREVRGRTLGDVIDEVHAAAGSDGFRETASGWTFRRLADAFARVCQAVAYAHRRGIVHRDLKPDNLMTGELGEVMVMDWGLGRRLDAVEAEDLVGSELRIDAVSAQLTRHGDVLGTPAYMPPEQARGQRELHGLPSDVYALGAVLYHLLTGRAPYRGSSAIHVLQQVLKGSPVPIVEAAEGKPVPAELGAICERAMAREIGARYPDAEALAGEMVAWLDGARRREQALDMVAQARTMEPEIEELRARAGEKRAEAQAKLDGVRPFDPVERKEAGWDLEDEAGRLEVAAVLREAEWLEALQSALTVDPDLPEAHAALADHHREQLLAAERAHHEADAVRAEAQLKAHDRGRYARLLRGEGALTLITDPPGAEVRLERYVLRGRRLVAEECGVIGVTPIREAPLQKGSYRLRVRAPGRQEVLYPALIERGSHWDGVPPGEGEAHPVRLPEEGELGAEECHVPAGWAWIGGDPDAADSLPGRRIWIDAFVIGRFPVTDRDYLEFLNDLLKSAREAEAIRAIPQQSASTTERHEPLYPWTAEGRLTLPGSSPPDLPAVLIDWYAASLYAKWLGEKTGCPVRLPNELEREKAARGVDGRLFPWGNHPDATFACALESHRGSPARGTVGTFPADESPYGIRGLAGNVREWCANLWKLDGPRVEGGRLRLDPAPSLDDDFRIIRGGTWGSSITNSRSAARFGSRPETRWLGVGLRVARSWRDG